jgi:chorismate mutase/prephenate dehydratase
VTDVDGEKLAELRRDINRIDGEIVALLRERVGAARRIGLAKGDGPVYDPAREAEVMERVREHACSGDAEPDRALAASLGAIYREVLSLCRGVQSPLQVAVLGPQGSFSEDAARTALGSAVTLRYQGSIPDIFRTLDNGGADLGVVPIENTIEGAVLFTLDAFAGASKDLRVQSELSLPIRHFLVSEAASLADVTEVRSHPQALAQCRVWLRTNLPGAILVAADSTSGAAASVKGLRHAAAVCSRGAAVHHELPVLAEHIQDQPGNSTRFWVVGKGPVRSGPKNKTSVLFNVAHRPGTLFAALEPLYTTLRNLTHIQSRPLAGNPFEYLFFVDFEGHEEEETVKKVLAAMAEHCTFFRVLGSYPFRNVEDL